MILGSGQGKYEMSMEHFIVSESKKLMAGGRGTGRRLGGQDTSANLQDSLWPKLEYFEPQSKVLLQFNPQ